MTICAKCGALLVLALGFGCGSDDDAGSTAARVNDGDGTSNAADDDTADDTGNSENDDGDDTGSGENDDDAADDTGNGVADEDDDGTMNEPSPDDTAEPAPSDDDIQPSPSSDDDAPATEEPEPAVNVDEPEPSVSVDPDDDAPTEPTVEPTTEPQPEEPVDPCAFPEDAGEEDTSNPDVVVGDGTAESCTADAFIDAVASGGIITFDCGPEPVTITLDRPAKVFNDTGPDIVIDGRDLVTLSGGGTTRILYMNTCDEAQGWTTSHCNDQDHPRLTVQNLTFIDANSKSEAEYDGGGAIWVRGGRFKAHNSRFFGNVCADDGPDVGGGAIRVFDQYEDRPVYVSDSTFGAEGRGNVCSNGGALSSIGVSWTVWNSEFTYNQAIGNGGNPAESGTPGGGSGGAIYNDGNLMTLTLCSSRLEHNEVNAYGSAIFFVSNNHTGDIQIVDSAITNNIGGSWYPTYPQISNHDDTPITVINSTIE